MSYTPYLISNFATGLSDRLQPWISQDDSQQELYDGYVYRGTLSKREGYKYFAIGGKGGAPYRESRIIHTLIGPTTAPMVGLINSVNKTFTLQAAFPIVAGSAVVTGTTPLQVLTDDGVGGFVGAGVGTINYLTGAISVTFTAAPTAGTVTAAYTNGYLMTGVIDSANTIFTFSGVGQLVRGSVKVTGSNPVQTFTDNGLGLIGSFPTATAGTVDYIGGAISITLPAAPTSGTVIVTFSFMPGNPVMMVANFITASNIKELIVADTQYVNKYNPTTNTLVDITNRVYTGDKFDFFTWINYPSATSVPRLLFANNFDVIQQWDGAAVTDYVYSMLDGAGGPVTTLTCSFMVTNKDRLLLLRTTENGVVYPQRIRISGTGANTDDFRTSATGAGFIDISDGTWIQGAAFNRDDLVIFTEASVWVLKYTGNDTTPFVIQKIDESRGCNATFSVITYLNRTTAASPRGLIVTDGYRVEREDMEIPDFSFNKVSGTNFGLCFAGSVDHDRDHYLIYPPQGEETSTRILVTNYDEDNFTIYRLPLSCMGSFIETSNTTWNDLLPEPLGEFNNWDDLSAAFGSWDAFAFASGNPFPIGGGQNGEIWKLAVTESEDNPVKIYNITIIDQVTIQVTTDFNNYSLQTNDQTMGADNIFISGVMGMEEVNNQQYIVSSVISPNVFNLTVPDSGVFSAYTGDGTAIRVIPFSALFKKFNPFASMDKKVRCGWIYMYADSSSSDINKNISIAFADQTFPLLITTSVDHGLHTGDFVAFFGVGGMVELNTVQGNVTVVNSTVFLIQEVDATGFTPYTSGGYVSAAVPAQMTVDIITNDNDQNAQFDDNNGTPYLGTISNLTFQNGSKKWYKVYINQTGIFIQFRLRNQQAGAQVNVQATMPGFQAVGRII
jgi:hypothetical protein